QTEIVRKIQEKKADYVLSLKKNHPTLHAEVELKFNSLKDNSGQLGNIDYAQVLGNIIRQHWGIENQVHWTLDVTFNEDSSRIRSGHSPHNFALLRRWALNALRQETTLKRSLRQKQKRAAMNNDYMFSILSSFCQG
ncbi:ISAs1 family transposase, partial [Roseofilum casamattae]